MGLWTEFTIACELINETPRQVIEILDCISNAFDCETCEQLITPTHAFLNNNPGINCFAWIVPISQGKQRVRFVTMSIPKLII